MNSISRTFHILTLAGRDQEHLQQLIKETTVYISRTRDSLQDICYTANIQGNNLKHRLAVVGKSKEEIVKKLKDINWTTSGEQAEVYLDNHTFTDKIAFLFTGQGSLYPGLGEELYRSAPVFEESMQKCDELFSNHIHQSITRLLYGTNSDGKQLHQAIYSQPIIFSIGYSLNRLWESWGIKPAVVIGHSIGEYAAACAAGVFSLEEAVKLVAIRGNIMQQVPDNGKMIGVLMSEARAREIIAPYISSVSIAAVNTPKNVTLSGDGVHLGKITRQIKQERLFVEHLDISHPFHSIRMAPYVEKFKEALQGLSFSRPSIPVISTITGQMAKDEMSDADYWSTHIVNTVRFYDAVKTAETMEVQRFVEIGGTATLSGLAADCLENKNALFLPSLRKGNRPWRQLCNSLAQLYVKGTNIDWKQFHQPFTPTIPTHPITHPADQSIKNKTKVNINEEKHMEMEIRHKNKKKGVKTLQPQLKHMLEIIAGLDPENIEENASLFSLGIDSLMVIQLRKKISEKYNVDITINDFFTTYTSVKKISDFLIERVPEQEPEPDAEPLPVPQPKVQPEREAVRENTPGKLTVEEVIVKQLELMKRQQQRMSELMEKQLQVLKKPAGSMPGALETRPSSTLETQSRERNRNNPYLRTFKHEADELTAEQKEFIHTFIAHYNARTQKSKAYAQDNRRVFNDWINSLNFRISLKELIYPIVSQRSEGDRFWDIDGNEYIDISTGFGANYFGHRPGFVVEALEKQIKQGYELATQSNLAGEVAGLISRLTGVERVVFSNTGTEAVMAAVRIARSVTGRKKIVRFAGSFHGTFDGILAEADENGTFPISPGTPPAMVADIIVLPYGSSESLEEIERLGEALAGVLVEPVQSRRPGFHPRTFLHRLREITTRIGAAFILDDIYMGFRIHQGGSQAYFGIEADIVTYGKVIGGGMPIGVVAGKAKFLDVIDGGYWSYGDDSYPSVQPTLFAGTFCRHPLTMAAAYAVLKHMQEQGPQLQEKVNQKTQHLVNSLNQFFEEEHVPIRVRNFGSLFLFESFGAYDLAFQPIEMNLFYYLMIHKGVYIWERRVCCLSTAHTHEHIQYIIKAVKESIKELRKGGFTFSARSSEEKQHQDKHEQKKLYPLTPAQQQYFILNQITELEKAVHLTMAMTIKGPLQVKKLESTMQGVIKHHDIIRVGFEMKDGEIRQHIHDIHEVKFSIIYKKAAPDQLDESIEAFLQPFDLAKPPLIRIGVVEMSDDYFLLIVDTPHIISDGDSANILVQDLIRLYQGNRLPPVEMRYEDYLVWWQDYLISPAHKTQEKFWIERYSDQVPRLCLPLDFPRGARKNFAGGLVKFRLDAGTTNAIKQLAKTSNATLFMVLLTSYFILLNKLSRQEDITVGIPVSLRSEKQLETIIGYLTNNLVLRARSTKNKTFADFLKEIQADWMEAYLHKEYPYEMLVEKLQLKTDLNRNPLFDAMFIYENVNTRLLKTEDLDCDLYYFDTKISIYDFTLEVSQEEDFLDIKLFYSTQLFKKETIQKWQGYFMRVLAEVLPGGSMKIGDILKESGKEMETALAAGQEDTGRAAPKKRRPLCPPTNEIERKLVEIWQQELNTREIGTEDNFFELGGRSFDTIRTVSKVNQRLGVQISLAAIFEYPTVKELARLVEKTPTSPLSGNTTPVYRGIPAAPSRPAYELSPGQMRYWVNALTTSRGGAVTQNGVEITADVIILEGTLDYNHLKQAMAEVFKRHDILRTIYTEENSKPVQIIHHDMDTNTDTKNDIPIEYYDLSAFPPDQRDKQLSRRLLEEYNREFNLNTWPLIRFFVYKIEETRHILFCNAPHISFDGWSFTIILEEAAHFYKALKLRESVSPLPAVPRYVDYVDWNKQRLESSQMQEQANYWTQYLTRKIPVVHLPYDYDDETANINTKFEPSKVYQLKLSPQLTGKIYKSAARDDTTIFVTMLAILEIWIAALANQTIITVGTIFSGRTYPGLEKIPGIMMNLLPIRLDFSGNPDGRQILERTKQAVQETYNNQDYPLDLVAHRMRKVINLNRDIYSIVFIGQEALGKTAYFDDLKTSSRPLVNLISGQDNKDDVFLEGNYYLQQDLIIEMFEEDQQIKLLIRYNNRRFRSQTIKKYFDHFKSMAEQFLDTPHFHLSQFQSLEVCDIDDLF